MPYELQTHIYFRKELREFDPMEYVKFVCPRDGPNIELQYLNHIHPSTENYVLEANYKTKPDSENGCKADLEKQI
jgi:hypothetical protein